MFSLFVVTVLPSVLLVCPPEIVAQEAVAAESSQPLQPGDALQVSFSMEPELKGLFYVDGGGQVLLPILEVRAVGDLPASELKEQLVEEYDVHLRNQTVQITWLRRVRVFGAVNVPGL